MAWLKPARLLASVLEAVAEVGIGIGGRKSAGLGLLELESSEFHAFEPGKDGGGKEVYNSDPYSPRTDSIPELRLSLVTREHEREVMECRSTAAFGPVLPPCRWRSNTLSAGFRTGRRTCWKRRSISGRRT